MHLRSRRRLAAMPVAICVAVAVLSTGCSPAPGEPTALAMVDVQLLATPTALATTAPLDMPTATPTALPIPTAVPPTEVPETIATSVPPTAVAAALASAPAPSVPTPTAIATIASIEPTSPPAPTVAPEPTATVAPAPIPTIAATPAPIPTVAAPPEPIPTAATTPAPVGQGGPPVSHVVTNVGYVTLGQAGLATVVVPAALVELVGYHQAGHPGAQAIDPSGSGLRARVLESRGRGTPARSAADIVVPPGEPLRAPVTGTVVAAREYVLYCEYQDKLVYIEPDGLPGWQVRLFHITGDIPVVGARVIAGETVVASGGANPLPFESQVDEFTAEPSWPHVHLEVVDTNIPDTRPPGGGCG